MRYVWVLVDVGGVSRDESESLEKRGAATRPECGSHPNQNRPRGRVPRAATSDDE